MNSIRRRKCELEIPSIGGTVQWLYQNRPCGNKWNYEVKLFPDGTLGIAGDKYKPSGQEDEWQILECTNPYCIENPNRSACMANHRVRILHSDYEKLLKISKLKEHNPRLYKLFCAR